MHVGDGGKIRERDKKIFTMRENKFEMLETSMRDKLEEKL